MNSTIPTKNIPTKALVVESPKQPFVLRDVVLDEVRPDEVLVEMKYTGLCHTVEPLYLSLQVVHLLTFTRTSLYKKAQYPLGFIQPFSAMRAREQSVASGQMYRTNRSKKATPFF